MSKPLADLINLSFNSGNFPNCIKTAKVIPVFKKGGQQNCNKYQSISLLYNSTKLIEKLVHKHLYTFLETNNCLFNY